MGEPAAAGTVQEDRSRPAFYALSPGGWRDYWTLLHPPYTAWHLSYVAIGAAAAPSFDGGRLGAGVLALFLGGGLCDPLRGAAHPIDPGANPASSLGRRARHDRVSRRIGGSHRRALAPSGPGSRVAGPGPGALTRRGRAGGGPPRGLTCSDQLLAHRPRDASGPCSTTSSRATTSSTTCCRWASTAGGGGALWGRWSRPKGVPSSIWDAERDDSASTSLHATRSWEWTCPARCWPPPGGGWAIASRWCRQAPCTSPSPTARSRRRR